MATGSFLPCALAAWDGGNPGKRAVSMWLDLSLEHPPEGGQRPMDPKMLIVWIASGLVLVVALRMVLKQS